MSATRRRLLGLAGAAAVLPAAGALGWAGGAAAQAGRSDVELLESLLVHEQRLAAAYEAALRRDAIEPRLGETLLAHEREHLRGVGQALAGAGRRAPRADVRSPALGAALRARGAFARFALDLEGAAVAAYLEALPRLRDPGLRRALGSIMVCAGTHQGALRESIGEPPLPGRS